MTPSSKQKWALIALFYAGLTVRSAAQSTTAPTLDARGSDPVAMGWMVGAPPPPDKLIRFADGSRQIANLDQTLSVRNPMLQVLLDGNNRRIDRIIVLGDSRRNASIQVFGI